jgi:hypothetical protein
VISGEVAVRTFPPRQFDPHMPVALKAYWEVQAGLIPKQPRPEYSKRFVYTSQDHEADQRDNASLSPAFHSRLAKLRAEALDYYMQVSMPQLNNWAQIVFVWV